MLALGLSLVLFSAPSARLLPEEPALSAAEVAELDREMRVLTAHIQELKPRIPTGYIVGIAVGFSFSVLVLPGIPLMLAALSSFGNTGAILAFGGVLTALGGLGLLAAIVCLVLGNNIESDLADERAHMVERRDQLKARLAPYQPPPGPAVPPNQPPVPPTYVPGVQLDVPRPSLISLARF
jgi:hypothetical protein